MHLYFHTDDSKDMERQNVFQIYVELYMACQAFRACLLYINVQGKAWRDPGVVLQMVQFLVL